MLSANLPRQFRHVKAVVLSRPLSRPKVCILTCHTDGFTPIALTTIYKNKAEYARRWKHDLLTLTGVSRRFFDPISHGTGITWDRLNVASELIRRQRYDWIYVVGGDTLITNMTIPLTTLIDDQFHFIISNDFNGWNADSFLIRCTTQGRAFADDALKLWPKFKHHCWVEQQAMIESRDKHKPHWKVLPQRRLNAYNYRLHFPDGSRTTDCAGCDGDWKPGDFLMHWAGVDTAIRIIEIQKMLPQIVR